MNSKLALVVIGVSGLLACGDSAETKDKPIELNNANSANSVNSQNSSNNANSSNSQNSTNSTNNQNSANSQNSTNNVNDSCPPEARPVYVVEADDEGAAQGKLVRFDPPALEFVEIGELDCPAAFGETPFSMSVDREANAWVLYSDGNIYKVSTTDASCEATAYQPGQSGYTLFGMGFVLDRPNFEDETLYIAGGSGPGSAEQPRIGYLTFPEMTVTDSAPIGGWPELSGTANAELWAFFPGTEPPRVSRIVPATGDEVETIPVDSITGEPNAWAFAHWGGEFFLFYKSQTDPSTRVFRVTREGSVDEVIEDSGRYIVGAGVSTCAPTVFQ